MQLSERNRERGIGLAGAIVFAAITLGAAFMVHQFSISIFSNTASSLKKDRASSNNDIIMSRAAHAMALGAVQCVSPTDGSAKGKCRWTSDPAKAENTFGFDSGASKTYVDKLDVTTEACLPLPGAALDSDNCSPVKATISFELVDAEPLFEERIIAGERATGDNDLWAVRVTAEGEYKEGPDEERSYRSLAMIRRPRMVMRIETGTGVCDRGCKLSEGLGPLLSCVSISGQVSSVGTTMGANTTVRVFNDGPGHVYRFQVHRRFVPNPDLTSDGVMDDVVYDSVAQGLTEGLAPGASVEFVDSGTPCYSQTINNTETSATLAGTTATEVRYDRVHSGNVYYTFVTTPDVFDPANAIMVTAANTTTQAQQITITTYRPPPPPTPPGGPTGGPTMGFGGGGDGGPDGPDGDGCR